MMRNKVLSIAAGLLVFGSGLCWARTPAPSFTISATNVTMPSSGVAEIPFTLTSANGFAGTLVVLCEQPTVAGSVNKGPYCDDGGPVRAYTLVLDGTATGNITITAKQPLLVPATAGVRRERQITTAGWAIAGVLLLGLGLRRKRVLRFSGLSLALFLLIGLAGLGLSGCGGPPTLTPGPYTFSLIANSVSDTVTVSASTTAIVTVPPGIVTSTSSN
jgi:hypothetical protein